MEKNVITTDQNIDAALLSLLHQLPDSAEAQDVWREVITWAQEIYQETGRPATLDDLYRDLPNLDFAEELYEER